MSPERPPPDAQATTDVPLLAGRYQLLDKLGEGGMGAVFRARDAKLDRHVAIKMLPEGSVPDGDAVGRFQREARALARLSHPGIIQAYDSGEDGGRPFLVMELVEGRSLSAVLRDTGRVSPARAADFAYQAALALQHAHKSGLIHRDVKPSNLLLSADGRVRLLDLGLARFLQDQIGEANLTRTGTGLGTPDYASPEQFRDAHKADPRSDIYSLGCTLYHLIAGRVPFPGSSFSEKVEAHETKEAAPLEDLCPEVPVGLALAARRMMAKNPAHRFQMMAEVVEVLMPHVTGSSASFPHIRNSATWDGSRLATMLAPPRRRVPHPWLVAGTAAILLVVIGLVGLAAGWFRPAGREVPAYRGPAPEPGDTEKPTLGQEPIREETPKAADDPNVLTVSKEARDGGTYRTIGEALEAVEPGQTIRVLDGEVYRESLSIKRPSRHAGITLEAPRHAVIETTTSRSFPVDISGVKGVTLRHFRLRAKDVERSSLVVVVGDCSGLRLEGLEMSVEGGGPGNNGVELHGWDNSVPSTAGAVLLGCRFRRCGMAVALVGASGPPIVGVAVRDGTFIDCAKGVTLTGHARQVQVTGNRFWGMGEAAIQFELLSPDCESILLANNTCYEGASAFRLWDDAAKGKDVQICNNLVFDFQGSDMHHIDAINHHTASGPGDGAAVARAYRFGHNWRERRAPAEPDAKGWIPPDEKKGDVIKDKIDRVNRDPKSPDFLRPDKDSPLATAGGGTEDPSLPCYVGALPPEGVEPWDWERASRLPKDAQLLTVSKESKDGGKYGTINDALKAAKPWTTIRVLDQQDYAETLKIDDKGRFEGLVLEAIRGAALVGGPAEPMLTVADVPNVLVRGLRFHEDETPRPGRLAIVLAKGAVPGLVLEGLELTSPIKKIGDPPMGVVLQDIQVSRAQAPAVVRRCTIRVIYDGVHIASKFASCSGVRIEQNLVQGLRAIWVGGTVHRIQVAGNRILDCSQCGLQIENLHPSSGQILIANNTVGRSKDCFRYFLDAGALDPVAGQAQVCNNLLFGASMFDMGFERGTERGFTPGNHRALSLLWQFGYNGRDLSGSAESLQLLLDPTDQLFDKVPLDSTRPTDAGFLRPAKGSAVCSKGAGSVDAYLPRYIGAVSPEGVEPWDWDRTWWARMKKKVDKK